MAKSVAPVQRRRRPPRDWRPAPPEERFGAREAACFGERQGRTDRGPDRRGRAGRSASLRPLPAPHVASRRSFRRRNFIDTRSSPIRSLRMATSGSHSGNAGSRMRVRSGREDHRPRQHVADLDDRRGGPGLRRAGVRVDARVWARWSPPDSRRTLPGSRSKSNRLVASTWPLPTSCKASVEAVTLEAEAGVRVRHRPAPSPSDRRTDCRRGARSTAVRTAPAAEHVRRHQPVDDVPGLVVVDDACGEAQGRVRCDGSDLASSADRAPARRSFRSGIQ